MAGILPFPTFATTQAVERTFDRLANVAAYLEPYYPDDVSLENAALWRGALQDGNGDRLLENIRKFDALAINHLEAAETDTLKRLIPTVPGLWGELQANVERLERLIGVALPLRISVFADWPLPERTERGMALLLKPPPVTEDTIPIASALQVFLAAPSSSDADETVRITVRPALGPGAHSPFIRRHFARETIEELGPYGLAGEFVTPLVAPERVFLTDKIVRVGRFSFLGLERPEDASSFPPRDWGVFHRHVDVLVFGVRAAAEPGFVDRAIFSLRPRLALLAAAGAASVRRPEETSVLAVTPGASVSLEFHPVLQSIVFDQGYGPRRVPLNRAERVLNVLEAARPEVTRGISKSSRATIGVAVASALRYLLLLDSDPYRFASAAPREEKLASAIDDMTASLSAESDVYEHIRVFRDLLLASGLLARSGGR